MVYVQWIILTPLRATAQPRAIPSPLRLPACTCAACATATLRSAATPPADTRARYSTRLHAAYLPPALPTYWHRHHLRLVGRPCDAPTAVRATPYTLYYATTARACTRCAFTRRAYACTRTYHWTGAAALPCCYLRCAHLYYACCLACWFIRDNIPPAAPHHLLCLPLPRRTRCTAALPLYGARVRAACVAATRTHTHTVLIVTFSTGSSHHTLMVWDHIIPPHPTWPPSFAFLSAAPHRHLPLRLRAAVMHTRRDLLFPYIHTAISPPFLFYDIAMPFIM